MWWQDAVIYQVYPRSFQDSDGDGIGDLPGIERRLDHLAWLGVDALWLSPIYPSPMHDMGYDVADYKGVDPVFGTLEDFDRLVASARERGLRVVLDVVPCHTSIEHPWFTRAPRLVHLARRAEQLAVGVRRLGVVGARRALLPPLVLSRAARPGLAQPGGGRGDAGRAALLGRARRRRLPRRRDRPAPEGPRAARRPARDRGVRAAAERGGGEVRAHELAQRAGHARGAGEDPRGGGGPRPDRRGVPAERAVAAVPRVARRRVCVRAAALRVGRRDGSARPSRRPRAAPARRGCSRTTTSAGS